MLLVFGLLLCALALLLYLFVGQDGDVLMAVSICFRAGILLGVIWLAFPQAVQLLSKYPPWVIASTVVTLAVLVVRPKAIIYVLPLLAIVGVVQFVGWIFAPPPRKSPDLKPGKKPRK